MRLTFSSKPMKLIASFLIAAAFVAPVISAHADEAAKADAAKGEALFATNGCVGCHGVGGNSTISANPKLAQQHAAYIEKQLHDFKAGKRVNAIMSGMAAGLSDADMKNVAAYVHSQKMEPGLAQNRDLVAIGERIYRGGIPDRQIPACAGCHAPNGAGIPDQYPRLAGQHAEYVAAQLSAFRDSDPQAGRKNNPTMNQVAAKLNDREIKAVADYIAGLRN
jgi:cytochrome c553